MNPEKTKSPYYGVFSSSIFLIGFTALMIFIFDLIFHKLAGLQGLERRYSALCFGSLVGDMFYISCCIAGLLKGKFKVVVNRIKEFKENLAISFKFAIKYYWENIKEEGIAFWIYFIVIFANFALTIYSFTRYFEIFNI